MDWLINTGEANNDGRTPASRQGERDKLARDVAAFMAEGGTITRLGSGGSSQGAIGFAEQEALIRWAKQRVRTLNHNRLIQARRKLEKTPGARVNARYLAALTGLTEKTVTGWRYHAGVGWAARPVETSPTCQWLLRDVVRWCDWLLDNSEKTLTLRSL